MEYNAGHTALFIALIQGSWQEWVTVLMYLTLMGVAIWGVLFAKKL
jgi:hypothetical protein